MAYLKPVIREKLGSIGVEEEHGGKNTSNAQS